MHYRKFIGLDGCFLKTPQGGQLLTAIGWNPNDQMLPIAYAVVESETKDTWTWFLKLLIDDFGSETIGRATFMSDQQKGLLSAFDEVIPGVDHRFCVRHFYNNFRKKFSGLHLKQLMWRKWQLSRIPCTHAISCINFKGLDMDSYVDDCYKREAYVKCYDSIINPLNGPDLWEHTNFDYIMPPPYRKPSHRPVKKRKGGPNKSEARS
ncbi:hypothetical protein Ahy_B09g098785 [Arachis hypogaea]|uniref:MULE transposase domain-containing protein n=1 Tax=Arachis hypogaea TaxID=3818 RepID=A0A444XSW6_ARAHY|nr:hypothetical protein Ahy_B09g098785 [Arachis hypogaea]